MLKQAGCVHVGVSVSKIQSVAEKCFYISYAFTLYLYYANSINLQW
jgi:hypothetical protein